MYIFEIEDKSIKDLKKIATDLNVPQPNRMKREGLIVKIAQTLAEASVNGALSAYERAVAGLYGAIGEKNPELLPR